MSKHTPPAAFEEAHREFLNDLRESGDTNMLGARPYLMREFPELSAKEAGEILSHWMETFTGGAA